MILVPHNEFHCNTYTIDLVLRPSVLENSKNWKIFNNNHQIIAFIEKVKIFEDFYFEGSDSPSIGTTSIIG
jgi:membrane-anchored protein YejM (alkaline phosphatase superfamily)